MSGSLPVEINRVHMHTSLAYKIKAVVPVLVPLAAVSFKRPLGNHCIAS